MILVLPQDISECCLLTAGSDSSSAVSSMSAGFLCFTSFFFCCCLFLIAEWANRICCGVKYSKIKLHCCCLLIHIEEVDFSVSVLDDQLPKIFCSFIVNTHFILRELMWSWHFKSFHLLSDFYAAQTAGLMGNGYHLEQNRTEHCINHTLWDIG